MIGQQFSETGRIIRILFRQNRLKIFLWLIGIIGVSLAVAYYYPEIYATQEDIYGFGQTMDNPAMKALIGSIYPLEEFTNVGVVFASEMLLFTAIASAIMNILLMNSATRLDEDEGRIEIVQSLPVGRLSYLTAATILLLVTNLVLVLVLGTGLTLIGAEAFTTEGSFLYSSILGITGFFFAGVTALFGQLSDTSRGNISLSLGFLILAYTVRGIGDVLSETLSLISPLGWTVRTGVFANNNWTAVLVLALAGLVFFGIAYYLNYKRDLFSGLLPARPGNKNASVFLKNSFGFVWHLEKTKIIAWFIILFLLSGSFGAILGELEAYFSDMDLLQQLFMGGDSTEFSQQFITFIIAIMSSFTSIPAITILLDLRKEEKLNRTEHFYSRSLSRTKMLGVYYIYGLAASVLMQLAIGFGLYTTASQVMEESISLGTFLEIALVYIPALWFVLGLVTLLVGLLPKIAQSIWVYIAFVFVVLYLGGTFDFPAWVNNLSVFHYIPELPTESLNWATLLIICGLAVLLSIIGIMGYNRRDMEG